jgi:DNA-binding CsgD family transcriptional regulator
MAVVQAERTRDEVVRLVHRGLGVRDFSLAVARTLGQAVPFDGVCVLTIDPATLLPTDHVIENGLPDSAMARYLEIEIREPDVNKFADLARSPARAASLSAATGGVLDRSRRHHELRGPNGFGDELRSAFVGDSRTWGAIVLLREAGAADFTAADARLVASLSALLAEGMRRALLLAAASDPRRGGDEPEAGLLLLAGDESIAEANDAAAWWLDELGADPTPGAPLPLAIRTVGLQARAPGGEAVARARVRTPSGRWLLVRGTMLGGAAAVMLEPARPPELAPLIADAYALTARERVVTQLVAQGLSTSEIAGRLFLSPYTVQDHLKAIFEKVGVGTRGEVVARLFFDHYAPRLTGRG